MWSSRHVFCKKENQKPLKKKKGKKEKEKRNV